VKEEEQQIEERYRKVIHEDGTEEFLPIPESVNSQYIIYKAIESIKSNPVKLSVHKWLGLKMKHLIGGQVLTVIARTGSYKTFMGLYLCEILEVESLLCDLELSVRDLGLRLLSVHNRTHINDMEKIIEEGGEDFSKECFQKVLFYKKSSLTPELLEAEILNLESFGRKPKIVILDYFQLLKRKKDSYLSATENSEELRRIAARNDIILVIFSQVGRDAARGDELSLYDAKESGGIENSSNYVVSMDIVTIKTVLEEKKRLRFQCLKGGGSEGLKSYGYVDFGTMRFIPTEEFSR